MALAFSVLQVMSQITFESGSVWMKMSSEKQADAQRRMQVPEQREVTW